MEKNSFAFVTVILTVFVTAVVGLGVAACGGAGDGQGAQSPSGVAAEQIIKTKCTACHAARDPGILAHDDAVAVMKTHRDEKRATLADDDWAKLIDFLSKK